MSQILPGQSGDKDIRVYVCLSHFSKIYNFKFFGAINLSLFDQKFKGHSLIQFVAEKKTLRANTTCNQLIQKLIKIFEVNFEKKLLSFH